MKLTFCGAAKTVTGSKHLVELSNGSTLLLDCGLFQGGRGQDAKNAEPFPIDPARLDAVVLSHAHIDHSGRLPLLVRRGFRGPVHAQRATLALADILLRDAADLEESSVRRTNRRRARRKFDSLKSDFRILVKSSVQR